jgi:hypothetical protein
VQFLKHKCAVTNKSSLKTLTKIALKQSSHLLVTLVDAPENSRNAVIEHQKYKRFLWEDSRPSYFPQKSLTFWGNGKEDKIGSSEAPQKRLEWENLIFFAA